MKISTPNIYLYLLLAVVLTACNSQKLATNSTSKEVVTLTPKDGSEPTKEVVTLTPKDGGEPIQEVVKTSKTATSDAMDDRGFIVKIGDLAPDFSMTLTDGTTTSMKELQAANKVVMLQFTASWCGVCRKEMPHIESEIWQLYKDKGLIIVGVDRDEPLEKALQLKEKTKITYPLALDPNADIFARFAAKNQGVTRNVIIDQTGKIVFLTRLFKRTEFDKMKEVIKELLES